MDLITKNSDNSITCNISNEVLQVFFTVVIDSDIYRRNVVVMPQNDVNGRYTIFAIRDGIEDLQNGVIDLPTPADYPYSIINTSTEGSSDGLPIHRGIMRYKQPSEDVKSFDNREEIKIYE